MQEREESKRRRSFKSWTEILFESFMGFGHPHARVV
jgi:hypothetical protein